MTLDNNLMMRIKNAANVIKITNMTYQQQQIFLNNTRPEEVAPADWILSVMLYLTTGEKLQAAE